MTSTLYPFFILSALVLMSYLLLKKRKIDVFTVGGLSALLFSFPLFLGSVKFSRYSERIIENEVYLTFIILFFILLIFMFLFDVFCKADNKTSQSSIKKIKIGKRIYFLSVVFYLVFLIYIFSRHGYQLLYGLSKREIMDLVEADYVIFMYVSIITATYSFLFSNFWGKLIAFVILLLTILMGQRTPTAIAGISIFLVYVKQLPPKSLLLNYPIIVFFIPSSILGMAFLKPAYAQFKAGGLRELISFFSSHSLLNLVSRGAEFTSTQYQFNEIVLKGFSTNGMHIIRGPLSFFPIPRSWYTTPSSEFNDLFQPILFPDHISGMAYNPFAEFYAGMGLIGVVLYIFMYASFLFYMNILFKKSGIYWSPFIGLLIAVVAFYTYRNSVAVTFGLIRNLFWLFISVFVLAKISVFCLKNNKISRK